MLDEAGRWHTPVACAVLDNRSRICCHLHWYLTENAHNLAHGLTQAMLKRGLPRALMTDNGSATLAEETREASAVGRFRPAHGILTLMVTVFKPTYAGPVDVAVILNCGPSGSS